MAKRGRKTAKAKDNKGYLDTNASNNTPYKIIKGNKITMEGVSKPIYAIPLDSKGKPGKGKIIQPGENYEFEGASQVLEIPEIAMAQTGLGTSNNIYNQQSWENIGRAIYENNQPRNWPTNNLAPSLQGVTNPNYQPTINTTLTETNNTEENPYTGSTVSNAGYGLPDNIFNVYPAPETVNTPNTSQQPESIRKLQSILPETNFNQNQELANEFDRVPIQSVGNITPNNEIIPNENNVQQSIAENTTTNPNIPVPTTPTNTPTEGNGVQETRDIQFLNPYGGVDIPTAANALGASLSYEGDQGGANTARGVFSGLKLLTGLGRNIMSGYASNKRNQFVVDEANEDQRRSLQGPTQALQEGGSITERDLTEINNTTGHNFDLEFANELFTHTPQPPAEVPQGNIDFGRYKDVGYFDTAGIEGGKRVIYNTERNPMNYSDNLRNALDYLQRLNNNNLEFRYRQSDQQPVSSMQKGGEVTANDLLTGAYMTGSENQIPNVEVEAGEHIKDNETGKVQEVIGNKHSQGGEPMQLDNHQVLSDFNKIGGDKAKEYRDLYDIKVKAKDTYATVMDKVLKKTGYTKLTDELKETVEKVEKEQKREGEVNSEATTGINLQFLSGKVNELNTEMQPLEDLKTNVFNKLFEDQQGEKTEAELQEEDKIMQGGGEEVTVRQGPNPRTYTDTGTQSFTNRDLSIAGDVTEDNLLEIVLNLIREFPTEVQQNFDVPLNATNATDITARSGDIRQSIMNLQEDINNYYDTQIQEATETITDPQERTRVIELIENQKFTPDRIDGIIGNETASRRRIDINTLRNQDRDNTTTDLQSPTPETEPTQGDNTELRRAYLPNQVILPPSSMQPHRLGEVSPREAEATLISPQAQLEEINRNYMTMRNSINTLPDGQRRAALAELNTTTQTQINQIMGDTTRANAQIENQTEQFNVQQQNRAEMMNEELAQNYEQRSLTALDNTQQDIRNYFNALNRRNVAEYNTIQGMNLTNAMYDNFQYDGRGSIVQTGTGPNTDAMFREFLAGQQMSMEDWEEFQKENKKNDTSTQSTKRGRKIN